MQFARASVGGPVDRAVFKMIVAADAVRRSRLVGGRIAQDALLPPEAGPLVADCAVQFARASVGGPIDRAVFILPVMSHPIGAYGFILDPLA